MDGEVGRKGSWSVQGHPDKFHFVEDGIEIEQSDGWGAPSLRKVEYSRFNRPLEQMDACILEGIANAYRCRQNAKNALLNVDQDTSTHLLSLRQSQESCHRQFRALHSQLNCERIRFRRFSHTDLTERQSDLIRKAKVIAAQPSCLQHPLSHSCLQNQEKERRA